MQDRKIKFSLFLFCLFLFFPYSVYAESTVVINEFLVDPDSAQWVELYNKGQAEEDISGWVIDDNGGTEKFTIPPDTIISPLGFKVFESGHFNLNRTSPDKIQLLHYSTVIDSYAYDTGPGQNNSIGREKDGGDNMVIFSSTTKGASNNSSAPLPSPTPTLLPTSTPTIEPTPTKTPTPTSTPKPLTPTPTFKIPTPTKIPTPGSTPTSLAPTKIIQTTAKIKSKLLPSLILGMSTKSAIIAPSPQKSKPKPKILTKAITDSKLPFLLCFVLVSVLLITSAIIYFIKIKKSQQL